LSFQMKYPLSSVTGSGGGGFLGGIGGLLGSLGKIGGGFGGFLAGGGSVTPGENYIVGERGAETFRAPGAGTIVPGAASGSSKNVNVTNHFHGISDIDTFRKSSGQIQRDLARSMQVASSRG
jgi:hypothetical protein